MVVFCIVVLVIGDVDVFAIWVWFNLRWLWLVVWLLGLFCVLICLVLFGWWAGGMIFGFACVSGFGYLVLGWVGWYDC